MTPAAAEEAVTPLTAEETAPATDPPPIEEPAAPVEEPAAPVEEPAAPAEEPAPPAEEPAAPAEEAAPEEAVAPDALVAEAQAEAPIAALALACAGWPAAGSPVAGFEIDGNMCVDVNGRLDWANVGGQPRANDGYDDSTQFTGGSKESNWQWSGSQISGSGVAPAKTDVGNVYAFTQTVGGHVYAYLGFERAVNNGSVAYHVELNQLPNLYGPVPNRTVGDLRLTINQTGSNLISLVGAETWDGDSWVSLGTLAGFVGQVNQGPIDNLSGAVLEAGTFAEVAVDLTVLFGNAGCSGNFGTLNVRSSSSPEDTSSLADWINPIALNVPSTCSTLVILKTDMNGAPLAGATFSITPNPATGTGSTSGVTDATGRIIFNGNVEAGNYTIVETVAPPGYLLDSTPQMVSFGAQAQSKTLTFKDPLGAVAWLKHDGAGALLGGATFKITATGGAAAAAPWDLDSAPITVVDNGVRDTDPTAGEIAVAGLPTGTYSVVETVAPAGYILDSTPRVFTVSQQTPSPTITAPFVNIPLAKVTVSKVWVDAFPNDTAEIDVTGAATAGGTSTAPTNGQVVEVFVEPGDELDLAEVLPDANTGSYSTTLSCVGATVTDKNETETSGSITVPAYPTSANGVQCTFTNTALKAGVLLQKRWIGGVQGDRAILSLGLLSGGLPMTNTAVRDGVLADYLDGRTVFLLVRIGEKLRALETFEGLGVYVSTYGCTSGVIANALPNSRGFDLEVTGPAICTFVNRAATASVSVVKTWVNGQEGDTADLTISGGATDAGQSVSNGAVGSFTDDANMVVADAVIGQQVTVSEVIGVEAGDPTDYASSLVCVGADDAVLVDVDARTGSFTMPEQAVECEFVNEAELPTIALLKSVAGAPVADTNWQLSATPEVGAVVTNPAGGDVDPTEVATGVEFELTEEVIGDIDGLDEFEPGEWSCVSDIDGEIELSDSEPGSAMLGGLDKGENVVCMIVNSHVDQGVEFEKTNTGSVQNEDGTWTVTYDITVHNNSVLVPVEYDLIDTLTPTPGVTYRDADWSGPTVGSFALPTLTATLADGQMLAPYDGENDDVYTVVVIAEVTAAEPAQSPCLGSEGGIGIVNTAVLTIPGEEPDDSAACGTVHFDDVGIVKEAGRFDEEGDWVPFGAEDSVEPGESFQYVLTVTNYGTRDTLEPVVVTDPLHERLEVTDLELPAGWTNDNEPDGLLVDGDNVLSVRTPSMPAGAEVQIILTVLFTEMVQEPVMWDHDNNPETPDVEVDLPPVIGDDDPPPAPEVLNSIVNEACVETELDGDASNDCSEVETPVREIVASVYTRCVADAPFLGWTVVKSQTLLNEEIDMVWRPVNPDVTPETDPAQVEYNQPGGSLVWSMEVEWPGAEFTPSGVSIDYPGWRALAVTDYTADGQYIDPEDGLPMTADEIGEKIFNGLILDASELDYAWRGNTEITFTVNPELVFSTAYPPATPQCFVARHSEVQIEKTASVAHTEPGGSFTYSMAVQNVSDDSAAEGVVVTDVIPSDIKITDVSWPGEGDENAFPNWETCAVAGQDAGGFGGTLTCELFGPLQPIDSDNGGASAAPTITLAASVKSTATASVITNVGVVDYHTFGDPEDVGRDADDATVTLSALPATGGGTPWSLAIMGLLALLTGSAALVIVRRRRGEQVPTL